MKKFSYQIVDTIGVNTLFFLFLSTLISGVVIQIAFGIEGYIITIYALLNVICFIAIFQWHNKVVKNHSLKGRSIKRLICFINQFKSEFEQANCLDPIEKKAQLISIFSEIFEDKSYAMDLHKVYNNSNGNFFIFIERLSDIDIQIIIDYFNQKLNKTYETKHGQVNQNKRKGFFGRIIGAFWRKGEKGV